MAAFDQSVLLPMVALLAAVGLFAGVLAGLLGVGGGIVLVPAYFYTFTALGYGSDQLMQLSVATSLATIVVTSARSLASHNKRGAVDWQVLRRWGPGLVLGAMLAVPVVSGLRTAALQMLFGALATAIGLYMLLGRTHWRLAPDMPRGLACWLYAVPAGGLSALIGVGGGSFGVPLLSLHGMTMHRAVATAAGFGLLIAAPAVLGFMMIAMPQDIRPPLTVGLVNIPAFALTIAMTFVATPVGAGLAHRTAPEKLRRIFAVFLLLVAVNMICKALM